MTSVLKTLENLTVTVLGSFTLFSCQLNLASMILLILDRKKNSFLKHSFSSPQYMFSILQN